MTDLQSFVAVLPFIAFVLLAAYAVRENRKLNEMPVNDTEQNATESGTQRLGKIDANS